MVEESQDHQGLSSGTRCVVLVGNSGSTPADLLGGLSRRGVSTAVVTDPARAMVELSRVATGALVVVEPEHHAWLEALLEAVLAYHPPATVRWGYRSSDPSGKAQLTPLRGKPLKFTDPSHTDKNNQPQDPPKYIVPDPKSPLGRAQAQIPRERVRSLVVKVPCSDGADEPLISEEELAMLLGPVPDEQGGLG